MPENTLVRFENVDGIGVITIDNPPVNALSPGVPEGIVENVERGNADPAIRAMVLIGAGRSFIAGADIRTFGNRPPPVHGRRPHQSSTPAKSRWSPRSTATPWAAGSRSPLPRTPHRGGERQGRAARSADRHPAGSAGTQRLPRLIGPGGARHDRHRPPRPGRGGIPARHRRRAGAGRQRSACGGDRLCRRVADSRPLPRIRDHDDKLAEAKADPGMFDAMRRSIARRARNQKAPYHCIQSVENACTMAFDDGVVRERELFDELENSAEARALRYAFFAEREVARLPDIPRDTPLRPVKTAAIVGAGTMGGGISMSFAEFGFPVKLLEASREALDRGIARIRANYETSVKRGSLSEAEMNRRLALIEPVTSYDDIKDCDVVIEAVFERIPVKEEVFKKLDEVMKPGALLYSNTSESTSTSWRTRRSRPQDVAGTHFFAPANVMKLFEVVKGAKSAPDTLATGMDLGRKIGKISAMAGNGDGFVANRSRTPFGTEMTIMLEEGCLPEQVDKVMVDFGYPIGPFATADLSGLDIGYDGRQRRAAQNPNYRKLPIADAIVEMGRLGQKTGAGWFKYEPGDRTPRPDPEVARVIKEKAAEMGVEQRDFTDEEILRRLLFASVNEACKILDEGKAYRASDIDVMWLNGFGFPRYRGGLMYWADGIGVAEVYRQIAAWHQRYGERWAPSPFLRHLAETNTPFRDAKPSRPM